MTLAEYGSILRRRWLTIVAACLFTTAAAAGVTIAMPPTYSATASCFVSIAATAANSRSNTAMYQGSQFALGRVKSYPQLVQGPDVLEPVIHDLKLNVSTDQLAKHVSGDNPLDTVYVTITATSSRPSQAQAIANAVSRQLAIVVQRLETPKGGGAAPVTMTTAVPASLPLSPLSPRKALNLALGLVSGLAIGLMAAVLRQQRDTSVTSAGVLAVTGEPPLAVIRDGLWALSPAAAGTDNVGSSQYRRLGAVLRAGDASKVARVLVVTCPRHGEADKTTVACNLAVALSESGARVACVDSDPSGPGLAASFGLQSSFGLAETIAGPEGNLKTINLDGSGDVSILSRGTDLRAALSRPGALNRMASLLSGLKEDYDYIIVNSPALLPEGDAVILAAMADGSLVVAEQGVTTRADLAAAYRELALLDVTWLGTVLTSSPGTGAQQPVIYRSPSADSSPRDTLHRKRRGVTSFEHVDLEVRAG